MPRSVSRAFWFLLVPATGAYFAVGVLAGARWLPFAWFFYEQPLPAGIILFTVFEMTLAYYRHHLPGASEVNEADRDLPPELRKDLEAARHLLDEARRILGKHADDVAREVPAAARRELDDALQFLETQLARKPVEPEAFGRAFDDAGEQVVTRLKPWRKSELREYAESIGIAILVALVLREVVVEAFKIPSGSMLPTLQIGDHIFVNKFTYGPTLPVLQERLLENLPPEHGDVVVFLYPNPDRSQEREDYIKRVMGVPGDVLEAEDGHPIINGWRVPSCKAGTYTLPDGDTAELFVEYLGETAYIAAYDTTGSGRRRQGPFTVKPGEVWVFGDNRHNSSDSREWGGVPFDNIKGRAMFIWKPPAGMWSRLFSNVMGDPKLPADAAAEVRSGVEQCLAQRPSVADATPPPPSGSMNEIASPRR